MLMNLKKENKEKRLLEVFYTWSNNGEELRLKKILLIFRQLKSQEFLRKA